MSYHLPRLIICLPISYVAAERQVNARRPSAAGRGGPDAGAGVSPDLPIIFKILEPSPVHVLMAARRGVRRGPGPA